MSTFVPRKMKQRIERENRRMFYPFSNLTISGLVLPKVGNQQSGAATIAAI
ncbi:MAG: hypothetical protein KGJ59_12835 [Bacteroidota bacterium]|nr:hypothetical protein [Bacteroidota bacterium]